MEYVCANKIHLQWAEINLWKTNPDNLCDIQRKERVSITSMSTQRNYSVQNEPKLIATKRWRFQYWGDYQRTIIKKNQKNNLFKKINFFEFRNLRSVQMYHKYL